MFYLKLQPPCPATLQPPNPSPPNPSSSPLALQPPSVSVCDGVVGDSVSNPLGDAVRDGVDGDPVGDYVDGDGVDDCVVRGYIILRRPRLC